MMAPRERRPLLLAAGKRDAALADHRFEALREALNFAGDAGDFRRLDDFCFIRRSSTPNPMFSRMRLAEQERVLRHVSDGRRSVSSG